MVTVQAMAPPCAKAALHCWPGVTAWTPVIAPVESRVPAGSAMPMRCRRLSAKATDASGPPDLRMSAMIGDKAAFAGFVLQGAVEPRGMPNFGKDLSPEETEAIRAYVGKRANDLKAERDKR